MYTPHSSNYAGAPPHRDQYSRLPPDRYPESGPSQGSSGYERSRYPRSAPFQEQFQQAGRSQQAVFGYAQSPPPLPPGVRSLPSARQGPKSLNNSVSDPNHVRIQFPYTHFVNGHIVIYKILEYSRLLSKPPSKAGVMSIYGLVNRTKTSRWCGRRLYELENIGGIVQHKPSKARNPKEWLDFIDQTILDKPRQFMQEYYCTSNRRTMCTLARSRRLRTDFA
jgi:hypothetical protein